MMSPTPKLDPHAAVGLPEQRPTNVDASGCQFFRHGVAALCGLGLSVVALTLWLAPASDPHTAARDGVPAGGWVLQVLITGNLAVALLWVWLDWLAWRRSIQPPESRDNLSLAALFVIAFITFFWLILAGGQRNDEVLAMAMFLAFPTLAVMLPLLWGTVRRVESVRLGTLILVGFVAASALAQGCIDDSLATNGENLFVVNSYLVGLAVAVWLLSWAAFPEPSLRSAGWQPAVSPTGSRLGAGFSRPLRIANPRYGRLPVCATAHKPEARPMLELESTPQPPRTA